MPNARANTFSIIKQKKIITRNLICSNIYNANELEFCCINCYSTIDILPLNKSMKEKS